MKLLRLILLGIYEKNENETGKFLRNTFVFFAILLALFFSFVPKYSIGFIESILTIVSILFPLILSFLTFGLDRLKGLSEILSDHKKIESSGLGPLVSARKAVETVNKQDNIRHFIDLINSTGVISMVLLMIFIVLKQFPSLLTSNSNVSDSYSLDFYKSLTLGTGAALFGKFIINLLIFHLIKNCSLFLNYLTRSAKEGI